MIKGIRNWHPQYCKYNKQNIECVFTANTKHLSPQINVEFKAFIKKLNFFFGIFDISADQMFLTKNCKNVENI